MSTDQLSEVLRLVEARSAIGGGFAVGGKWTTRFELESPLKFMAMVRGSAALRTNGIAAPIELAMGDVAVLNSRRWATLSGGHGDGLAAEFTMTEANMFLVVDGSDDDVIIGGHVDVNRVGTELLIAALPPVVHVRGSGTGASEATGGTTGASEATGGATGASEATGGANAAQLRGLIESLYDEVTADRIGAGFAITQHAQLLVLAVLRAYIAQADELPAGWLRVLADERLRPAVRLMHAEPGKPWRLDELARAAAMSRTSFAERFREVAGVPPLTYLNRWRMLLAQRALRDGDTRVGPLAIELGYTSESAFSNAFKREVGLSPLRYRSRVRDELSGLAESVSV
ncbi:AraC family transcriptional regulator [Mycolicibacterium sp. P9-64]|uniref:AraC family transcriptional regulator n=1 Tax=Mycolicibacterium sp. P9-64 TaxID=2024612 RepID=UPI0011ECC81E|nr:AraC family transcriptional regulator [Mycolicibacterium sp. P9-64]KAA0086953.1 AraC family transcriptional regulator [Mycolicibacterium sp. P9-64]